MFLQGEGNTKKLTGNILSILQKDLANIVCRTLTASVTVAVLSVALKGQDKLSIVMLLLLLLLS